MKMESLNYNVPIMLEQKTLAEPDKLKQHQLDDIEGEVFVIKLFKVIEERCDELDYLLEDQGYEILHREYISVATSIYNYEVYFKFG